jgi:hypothetical protein
MAAVVGRSTGSLDLTEMSSQEQQLRELARRERFQTLRNWTLGLGFLMLVLSITTLEIFGTGNPKSASSIYAAFAGEGLMRWAFVPMAALGTALILVGAVLHGLSKRSAGEV